MSLARVAAADHRNREIERKAGVRLVDAARKPLPTTAFGWQRF
jgi:hypothetical protein